MRNKKEFIGGIQMLRLLFLVHGALSNNVVRLGKDSDDVDEMLHGFLGLSLENVMNLDHHVVNHGDANALSMLSKLIAFAENLSALTDLLSIVYRLHPNSDISGIASDCDKGDGELLEMNRNLVLQFNVSDDACAACQMDWLSVAELECKKPKAIYELFACC